MRIIVQTEEISLEVNINQVMEISDKNYRNVFVLKSLINVRI